MRRLTLVLALISALGLVPSAAAWTWPLGGDVLRPYSLGPDAYAAGQHRGVDVAGAGGESVRAPASGTVSFAGVVPGSGRTVTIQLDGYAVSLTHLAEISVVKGATVAEGQAIGIAGQSGDAEWPTPYVHLGIRVSAAADGYVDPATLLPPRAVVPPPAAVAPVAVPAPTPVAPPVVPPAAAPVVPPVAAPVPVVPQAVQVSGPDSAPGGSLSPAPSSVASSYPGPSPVAGASPREPVVVEMPPVRAGQRAVVPSVERSGAREASGESSPADRPSATVRSVTGQSDQTANLDPGSPPVALSVAGAGSSAAASPAAAGSDDPAAGPGASTMAATESVNSVSAGAAPAVSDRRNRARRGGIDPGVAREVGIVLGEPVERVTPVLVHPSGGPKRPPKALSATAPEGSTTVDRLSLLQHGRRWAVTAPALLLVALGTIWLLVRIRRLDRDGLVLRYGRALRGRRSGEVVPSTVRGSDRGRLA